MSILNSTKEKIYREYMDFFEKAERERRWNPFADVKWDDANRDASEELALCAETFACVEMYLPDYVSQGVNVVRDNFGHAWFQANWGYEESKHSLVLMKYLEESGKRTPEQMAVLRERVLAKQWIRPFPTARQITAYGMIQELATYIIYKKQQVRAIDENDDCLRSIYHLISRDEIAHSRFYESVIKVLLEEDREGTLADLGYVFANFKMPAYDLVPDYDDRIVVMRSAGIDRELFFTKVYFPILKALGTTRQEIRHAMKKREAEEKKTCTAEAQRTQSAEAQREI